MNQSAKVRSDRRFQLVLVIVGAVICAILGFLASQLLNAHERSSRKQALVRLISSSVNNDLTYTTEVAAGLRDNMLKANFVTDGVLFRELYHPSVVLPDTPDIGLFAPDIINALDEYRRRLNECEARRQECIQALEAPNHKDSEVTLLTYLIGLDSVVLSGRHFIREIKSEYPDASVVDDKVASYAPIQQFISELQKVTNEAITKRLAAEQIGKSP